MALALDIVQQALLDGVTRLTPQSLLAELQEFRRRFGFVPQLVTGAVSARDEWATLMRAGLCYAAQGNTAALLANAGSLQIALVKGQGGLLLIKRVRVYTNGAGATDAIASINPNSIISPGLGTYAPVQNLLATKNLGGAYIPTPNPPALVNLNNLNTTGTSVAIARKPAPSNSPVDFEAPGGQGYFAVLGDGGGDPTTTTAIGLLVQVQALNVATAYSVEFAVVPPSYISP